MESEQTWGDRQRNWERGPYRTFLNFRASQYVDRHFWSTNSSHRSTYFEALELKCLVVRGSECKKRGEASRADEGWLNEWLRPLSLILYSLRHARWPSAFYVWLAFLPAFHSGWRLQRHLTCWKRLNYEHDTGCGISKLFLRGQNRIALLLLNAFGLIN